ncbi:Uncharacterised protein [Mycobacteroides abscessus subsp. massiliense]|nr:Uncharacterised protein [Mycobacteroides abscessus subsp. massiliense]
MPPRSAPTASTLAGQEVGHGQGVRAGLVCRRRGLLRRRSWLGSAGSRSGRPCGRSGCGPGRTRRRLGAQRLAHRLLDLQAPGPLVVGGVRQRVIQRRRWCPRCVGSFRRHVDVRMTANGLDGAFPWGRAICAWLGRSGVGAITHVQPRLKRLDSCKYTAHRQHIAPCPGHGRRHMLLSIAADHHAQ